MSEREELIQEIANQDLTGNGWILDELEGKTNIIRMIEGEGKDENNIRTI
jgi:hypothetical protein